MMVGWTRSGGVFTVQTLPVYFILENSGICSTRFHLVLLLLLRNFRKSGIETVPHSHNAQFGQEADMIDFEGRE